MSIISERCKRLRLRAKEMCERAPEPFGPDEMQSSMSLFMLLAAKDMEEAADTIEALDSRLSVLCDQQDQIELLNMDCNRLTAKNHLQRAEIDKLRELCAEMFEAVKCCCSEWCTKTASNCDNNECGWHKCYVALRELGIEAD